MKTGMLRLHHIGRWPQGRIQARWTASARRIVPEIEGLIESAWARASARPGVNLFDGPMCRLEGIAERDGQLHLMLSRETYKTFVGTNMAHPELADRFGPQTLANPVGLSCILRSADGRLLLGRRSDTVAYYPGRVHPFAGSLEPGDGRAPPEVFADLRRELAEELSLGAHDVEELLCIGLAEDAALRQPELIFSARTPRPLAQLEQQLDAGEHRAIWSVQDEPSAVAEALASAARFTPVAVAALLLWGRTAYGSAWFEASAAAFVVDQAG